MLNKQVNDPDVAGAGQFVEENFYNLGLADHPLQALNAVARKDPNFRDDGRREITGRDSDAFKFRALTLRQLKDGRFFFHNGSFTSVKDVVQILQPRCAAGRSCRRGGHAHASLHESPRARLASRPGAR